VSIQTGYLIQSTGPKSCVITYLAQVDPKGEGLALESHHGILPYTTAMGLDLVDLLGSRRASVKRGFVFWGICTQNIL